MHQRPIRAANGRAVLAPPRVEAEDVDDLEGLPGPTHIGRGRRLHPSTAAPRRQIRPRVEPQSSAELQGRELAVELADAAERPSLFAAARVRASQDLQASTRLHGISASWPRRRRDSSPRNVQLFAAASPPRTSTISADFCGVGTAGAVLSKDGAKPGPMGQGSRSGRVPRARRTVSAGARTSRGLPKRPPLLEPRASTL